MLIDSFQIALWKKGHRHTQYAKTRRQKHGPYYYVMPAVFSTVSPNQRSTTWTSSKCRPCSLQVRIKSKENKSAEKWGADRGCFDAVLALLGRWQMEKETKEEGRKRLSDHTTWAKMESSSTSLEHFNDIHTISIPPFHKCKH